MWWAQAGKIWLAGKAGQYTSIHQMFLPMWGKSTPADRQVWYIWAAAGRGLLKCLWAGWGWGGCSRKLQQMWNLICCDTSWIQVGLVSAQLCNKNLGWGGYGRNWASLDNTMVSSQQIPTPGTLSRRAVRFPSCSFRCSWHSGVIFFLLCCGKTSQF